MKRILFKLIIFVLFALLIFSGCGGSKSAPDQTPTNTQMVNLTIRLKVPDYINDSSFHSQVVDLATSIVEINVSGVDIEPIKKTFNVSFIYNEEDYYETECAIKVPVGINRQFDIITRDSSNNILTTGSTVTDINLSYDNSISITLLPFEPFDFSVNESQNNSVAFGRTKYYRIGMSSTELCEITLQSSSDVRLLVFDARGSFNYDVTYNWGPSKGITTIIDNLYGSDYENTYYIGVLGNQEGNSNYTLTSREIIGTPFEANFQHYEDLEPQAVFPSIAATGTELNLVDSYGDIIDNFISIPIGFEFNYHGMKCDRVFVSLNGAISVQPLWDWWFSSYELGSPSLPNDLIALFLGDRNYDNIGKVFYELKGVAGSRELIIEYRSIELGSQIISGQIILCESPDTVSDPIKFLYDRSNCVITGGGMITIGKIGIENEDGSDTRGPLNVTTLPEKDLRFIKQ